MKKEISHEEKLEFYKKFHENDFNKKFDKVNGNLFKIGFVSLKVLSAIAIVGGLFNPWLFLFIWTAFDILVTCLFIRDVRSNIAIRGLSKNISYKDYRKMINSGEWNQLAHEYNSNINTSQNVSQILENNEDEKNLIKKTFSKKSNNKIDHELTNGEDQECLY